MSASRRPPRPAPGLRVAVRIARSARDVEAARVLFREYGQWLMEHREITAFDDSILRTGIAKMEEEIRGLPGEYRPPRGALLLVREGTELIGCGALRPLGPGVGELKRIYLRSGHRGRGLGRRLTLRLVARARRLGYDRLLLDTLPAMTRAIALYRSLGFAPVPPCWDHPFPGALFFGMELHGTGLPAGRRPTATRPSVGRRRRGRTRAGPRPRAVREPSRRASEGGSGAGSQ